MAYTALTFVYGEVLTATKMNALAANDASFHDGSGLPAISSTMLADNAVTTAKINGSAVTTAKLADSAVTAEKIDFTTLNKIWVELGRITFATDRVPNDTLTIPGGYNYIKICVAGKTGNQSGTNSMQVLLNGSTSYSRNLVTINSDGIVSALTGTTTSFYNIGSLSANTLFFGSIEGKRIAGQNCWVGYSSQSSSANDGSRLGNSIYNSSDDITSVVLQSSTNSPMRAGTEIIVYGHN